MPQPQMASGEPCPSPPHPAQRKVPARPESCTRQCRQACGTGRQPSPPGGGATHEKASGPFARMASTSIASRSDLTRGCGICRTPSPSTTASVTSRRTSWGGRPLAFFPFNTSRSRLKHDTQRRPWMRRPRDRRPAARQQRGQMAHCRSSSAGRKGPSPGRPARAAPIGHVRHQCRPSHGRGRLSCAESQYRAQPATLSVMRAGSQRTTSSGDGAMVITKRPARWRPAGSANHQPGSSRAFKPAEPASERVAPHRRGQDGSRRAVALLIGSRTHLL